MNGWRTALLVAGLAASCASTTQLFTHWRGAQDETVLEKRMQVGRFELDWDGMVNLESRPTEEVKRDLLAAIQTECPDFQLVADGEDSEEDLTEVDAVEGHARFYRTYYWIRYRCSQRV